MSNQFNNKNQNPPNIEVPLGDKGIAGERDDMLNPQISNWRIKFEHLQRYKYAIAKIGSGKKVLDLGCGTGYGSFLIYQNHNEVVGIDISQKAINYAKKKYKGPTYLICSAENLPFNNEVFDAVIAFEIIEHVSDPQKVINEIKRVLKNDGQLFISSPNLKNFYTIFKYILFKKPYGDKINSKNIYHIKEFAYDEFLNFIQNNNFDILFKYGQPFFPWGYLPLFLKKTLFIEKMSCFLAFPILKYAWTIVIYAKKK